MPAAQLEASDGGPQKPLATEPSQQLSDKQGWACDKHFTDSGTLSRTNSPGSSGPDWDGLDDAVCSEHRGPRFHLVKQLFGSRRESFLSEQETAQGDHSKCSSQGDNSKYGSVEVDNKYPPAVSEHGCCNSTPDLSAHRSPAQMEDGSQSLGPSRNSHVEDNMDEPGNRKACGDISEFRSWPLELRGRAAEWQLSPTVSSPSPGFSLALHSLESEESCHYH
jgi:hypothetical protein